MTNTQGNEHIPVTMATLPRPLISLSLTLLNRVCVSDILTLWLMKWERDLIWVFQKKGVMENSEGGKVRKRNRASNRHQTQQETKHQEYRSKHLTSSEKYYGDGLHKIRKPRWTSTTVMEKPMCERKKDLLTIQNIWAHQWNLLVVGSWLSSCMAASGTDSLIFTDDGADDPLTMCKGLQCGAQTQDLTLLWSRGLTESDYTHKKKLNNNYGERKEEK